MNNKKRMIYIGVLFIVTVIVSITYFSYAFLSKKNEYHGRINVVAGTLNYKISSDDLVDNSITLEANDAKEIEIIVTSLNQIESDYQLYTNNVENVEIGYLDEEGYDLGTGTIASNGTKTVKVALINNNDTAKTITFGVEGGFKNKEISLEDTKVAVELGEGICNPGDVYTFDYTGNVQTFKPRCSGTYKIEAWGAQGGTHNTVIGYGGYTSGNINLESNKMLYIYVGGAGNSYTGTAGTYAGGYNGGGAVTFTQTTRKWSTGGGATDIRYFSDTPTSSDLVWNSTIGLNSRIMVAGAGAGHGYYNPNDTCVPGSGGGLTGYNATGHYAASTTVDYGQGLGGTQTAGGWTTRVVSGDVINGKQIDSTKGGFGYAGGVGSSEYGYTSGGSGYYGGGSSMHVEDGGGGSSFISGYIGSLAIKEGSTSEPRALKDGCTSSSRTLECSTHYSGMYFTSAVMIDGKGCNWATGSASNCGANQPQPDGTNAVGHSGNGYARITYLGKPITLDGNGITVTDSVVYRGSKVGELPTLTRTGYKFNGWYDSENNPVSENTGVSSLPTDTIHAEWTPITYTVRFNANGGAGTMANQTFTYDQLQALQTNSFTRSGKTFIGWSTVSGTQLLYNSSAEKNSTNDGYGGTGYSEFMWYGLDMSPYFNAYGARDYSMMLDIKSLNTTNQNTQLVYCQNGNGSQWGFSHNLVVTTAYQTFNFSFVPVKGTNSSFTTSQLAFYGVYNTGNYASVKNVYLFLEKYYRPAQQISNLTVTDGAVIDLYAVWK